MLAEKLNVYGLDRDGMTKQEKACTSYKAAQDEFEKVRVKGDCVHARDKCGSMSEVYRRAVLCVCA